MHPARTATRRPLEHAEILVVEDNWHAATTVKKALESAGARVIGPASTLKFGHLLSEARTLDVAVVDVNLGGTVVYPLIERLDAAGVPVVVVTAYSFAGEVTANLSAVLHKPVENDALIEAVRAALRRAPAAAGRTRHP